MTYGERVLRAQQRVERAVAQTLAAIDDAESRIASGGTLNADPISQGVLVIRDLMIGYAQAARGLARAERLEPKPVAQVADAFPVAAREGAGKSLKGMG